MKRLLLLVALCTFLCAFAAAMVPRQRSAMEEEQTPSSTGKPICEKHTPCGWLFYQEPDIPEKRWERVNQYCNCAPNMNCQDDENDPLGKTVIKRCREPSPQEES